MAAADELLTGASDLTNAIEVSGQSFSHNRIRIFISSSMRDEGEFSWLSYREALDKLLAQSPFLIRL